MHRRQLLVAAAALGRGAAALGAAGAVGGARARVLVVGAGWGGLAAAHALAAEGTALDVTLIDRSTRLHSLPLSSAWLVDRSPLHLLPVDLPEWARRHGQRFVAAEVQAIERGTRMLRSSAGALPYDWLVLATGADYDDAAWYGGDAEAAALAHARYPAGFQAHELVRLKQQLAAFQRGTLVLTVPAPPYRCPPAPYERTVLIAWHIRTRGLAARILLLDAGGGMARFNRLFATQWADVIEHRTHTTLQRVDPAARRIVTDEGELRFDHAMLLPPMRASALVRDAGLQAPRAAGRAGPWAAVDPATLRSPHDERIYLVGDLLDQVSDLFGNYPKTAHVACDLGAAAAQHLAAASRGESPSAVAPPRSLCHVWLQADPPEQLILEARFRRRGDGVITQAVRQIDHTQPGGEDLAALKALMRNRLGITPG
jgi:NADPH-dependent 2,4-dienoyl-CoA reductase/sulfur reductase-like enzyme